MTPVRAAVNGPGVLLRYCDVRYLEIRDRAEVRAMGRAEVSVLVQNLRGLCVRAAPYQIVHQLPVSLCLPGAALTRDHYALVARALLHGRVCLFRSAIDVRPARCGVKLLALTLGHDLVRVRVRVRVGGWGWSLGLG